MEKRLAQIVSVLFHPYFLTLIGLLLLFNSGLYISLLPARLKRWIFLITALNTVFIPLSCTLFYLRTGLVKSLRMDAPGERIIPLIVNTILFNITYYILTRFRIPDPVRMYILVGAVLSFLALVINWKWKISLHMMGIGGLTGTLFAISFRYGSDILLYLVLSVLVSGIVGFSRLKNEAHDPFQVYSGYAVGTLTAFLIMYYF